MNSTNNKLSTISLKHIGLTALTLIILALLYWLLNDTVFSLKTREFNEFIYGLGWKAPLVIIGLTIAEIVIAPLPGGWIALANGFIFGHWLGFVYSYIGAVIGSWIAFELARRLGQPFVRRLVKPTQFELYEKKIHTSQWGVIALYAIPLFPIDIVSLLLGLTSISRHRYIKLMMLGFLPNMFILNFFGAQIYLPSYKYILIGLAVAVIAYFAINWLRLKRVTKAG